MTTSLYDLLGVTPDSTLAEIKTAFRTLAKKYHPDKNPGDPDAAAEFHKINSAYDVLTDPAKRPYYDQHGVAPDGPSPENVDAQLYGFVARALDVALKSAMEQKRDPDRIDLIAIAVAKLREDIELMRLHTKEVTKEIARLTKIRDRIAKKNGDDNVIARLFTANNITNLEGQLQHDREQTDVCERTIKFLADYEYRFDREVATPSQTYQSRQFLFGGATI